MAEWTNGDGLENGLRLPGRLTFDPEQGRAPGHVLATGLLGDACINLSFHEFEAQLAQHPGVVAHTAAARIIGWPTFPARVDLISSFRTARTALLCPRSQVSLFVTGFQYLLSSCRSRAVGMACSRPVAKYVRHRC